MQYRVVVDHIVFYVIHSQVRYKSQYLQIVIRLLIIDYFRYVVDDHIYGLMQERRNSIGVRSFMHQPNEIIIIHSVWQ